MTTRKILARRRIWSVAAACALVAAFALAAPAGAATPPTCGEATPTIVGSEGADVLVGTPGDDVIVGKDGNDLLCGGRAVTSSRGTAVTTS
jgi:Ca2+-binding RTX toxin-like protein